MLYIYIYINIYIYMLDVAEAGPSSFAGCF